MQLPLKNDLNPINIDFIVCDIGFYVIIGINII